MRAQLTLAVVAVVVFAALIAAIIGLVITNSELQAQNQQLTRDSVHLASTWQAMTGKSGHFVVAPGWLGKPHAALTKSAGATTCFECHQETFCSDCHVRGM